MTTLEKMLYMIAATFAAPAYVASYYYMISGKVMLIMVAIAIVCVCLAGYVNENKDMLSENEDY